MLAAAVAAFLTVAGSPAGAQEGSGCSVDLRIFDGQAGSTPSDGDEESRGAFTVLNRNDTNVNRKADRDETVVSREVDLMRLRLEKPQAEFAGQARLEAIAGADRIRVWERRIKGKEVALPVTFRPDELPRTLWVEGVKTSAAIRDVGLRYSFAGEQASCEDAVRATIVWARPGGTKHDRGDKVWPDFTDPPKSRFGRLCGGPGLRPPRPRPFGLRNCIVLRFQVLPAGVGREAGVRFDVSRQADSELIGVLGGREVFNDQERYPKGDVANDDAHNRDESRRPSGRDFLYATDAPGTPNPTNRNEGLRTALRLNAREFIRVRFDGTRPSGNKLDGSRASPRELWHARHTWVTRNGRLHRTTGNLRETRQNDVGPRNV